MIKKKEPLPTITQEEWEQFVDLYPRIKDIALLYKTVVEARGERGFYYFYPNCVYNPNKSGAYITEHHTEDSSEEWVPVEFILDPTPYLVEAEKVIQKREKENASKQCNAEFHQYLKLKEKFKNVEENPCE